MNCSHVLVFLMILPFAVSAQTQEDKLEPTRAAITSSTHKPVLNVVFAPRPKLTSMFIYVDDEPQIDASIADTHDVGHGTNRPSRTSLRFDAIYPNAFICRGRQCEGWLYEK